MSDGPYKKPLPSGYDDHKLVEILDGIKFLHNCKYSIYEISQITGISEQTVEFVIKRLK